MRIFVTGATGWVGASLVEDLIAAGHRVAGLTRSEAKAPQLEAAGAEVVRGTLDDLETLRRAASEADAVVHLAFNHDFSKFAENGAQEARALEAIGAALEGSDRPLLVTSGVATVAPGRLATERDAHPAESRTPRRSEPAAAALAERGVRTTIVRLAPTVHGLGEHGFLTMLVTLARERGVSAYVGDGSNRWPAVHRSDAARLYRLAVEHAVAERDATEPIYHAVAEEGVPFRAIAEAIGRQVGVPVEPRDPEHFGWFGGFVAADIPASSERTRRVLGWTPSGPSLLEDLDRPAYVESMIDPPK